MAEKTVTMEKTLQALLAEKKLTSVRDVLITMNPADVAWVLDKTEPEQTPLLFRLLPKDLAAASFAEMENERRETLIRSFSDAELRSVHGHQNVPDREILFFLQQLLEGLFHGYGFFGHWSFLLFYSEIQDGSPAWPTDAIGRKDRDVCRFLPDRMGPPLCRWYFRCPRFFLLPYPCIIY